MNTKYIHWHLISYPDSKQVSPVVQYIPTRHEKLYFWSQALFSFEYQSMCELFLRNTRRYTVNYISWKRVIFFHYYGFLFVLFFNSVKPWAANFSTVLHQLRENTCLMFSKAEQNFWSDQTFQYHINSYFPIRRKLWTIFL